MAEKGLVMQEKGDSLVIKMKRKEACAKCRACVAGLTEKDMILEAKNMCRATVDDWVEVEISESGFLFVVGIMYGIPLIALLAGIFIGNFVLAPMLSFINPDVTSFFTGLAFTGLAYLWIRSQEDRWKEKKITPLAVRVTTEPLPGED
ncbi:MAG: SoxR reducing system RseC family protein [Firmicutes bacterium]|nr:SoxR reducing system RseC family protein [Bacillota bacterium]